MNVFQRGADYIKRNGLRSFAHHVASQPQYLYHLSQAMLGIGKVKIKGNMVIAQRGAETVTFLTEPKGEFENTFGLVLEQFLYDEYRRIDPKDKIIIDIGANIGDTALYFAAGEAKHIYAYEMNNYFATVARKNLSLNEKLAEKITYMEEPADSKKLNELIQMVGPCSIKIDCDNPALEEDLIKNLTKGSQENIREIIMEYSNGYENIKENLLKYGFIVAIVSKVQLPAGILYASKP